ncbi:MAG: AraC family transcriptional regulator [Planctomycetota bacterium]
MAKQDSRAIHGTYVLDELEAAGELRSGLGLTGRALALHAMPTAAGHEQSAPTYDWHGLKRNGSEWCLFQYTLEGRGQLAWEGKRYVVMPGQAMLLWFPHDNRYWLANGDHWRHLWVCLSGREVDRIWRTMVARRGPVIDLSRDHPVVTLAADACLKICRSEVRDPFTASALAYSLAMSLLTETVGPDATPRSRHPGIDAAKTLARSSFSKNIGVTDLARAAGMSRHHFARTFARAEGVSPSTYLADVRTNAAARLLRETDLSVRDIGVRCGFRDAAYFCRAFRRMVGVSPGIFRGARM